MTAKWVLVFGALHLLDGGLLRSWGDALVWPLIGILLWVPFGVGVVWHPKKDQRVELTARELRVRRKRLPMEQVNSDPEPAPAGVTTTFMGTAP
ncbi:hypothetical protein ABZ178_31715 [Streptomyces massasporeus]|uniref:hypothetical protein n=1 Tax=Streptomyces massasporeus TaxID=67324 RepID=UPI0033A0E63B